MPTDENHVLFDVDAGIATITLNRPKALNALSPEMREGLIDVTGRCERDDAIRCVVLRGAGACFMAGGDVKGLHQSLADDRQGHLAGFEMRVIRSHQVLYQLRRMPKPVLAVVQGAAAGFGLGLALAADLVVASTDAYFVLAHRHIGLTPDGGATYFLPRVVGEKKAMEIALLGERLGAAEAHALGLVNWLVEAAELQAFSATLARKLATGPTVALGRTKRLLRSSLDCSWDEQSHREAENVAFTVATEDHAEGVAAFVEKRKPAFKGR